MAAIPLPPCSEPPPWLQLWDEFQIEIPTIPWGDQLFLRISIQAYNCPRDVDWLVSAVAKLV
jgi:hypothetical protein